MASTSHSGQIRNSHSPSVIALSSAKAPSTAAAKPRTCRKRKVKCDERGRNPETVAYGDLLSTSSGCKRCEDSGRPCYGYGAQPPIYPLMTHYPPSNLNPDSSLGARPYYSFSSRPQDNVSIPTAFPAVMGNVEPDPRYVLQSMQLTQPFEQSFPENHATNYGLRMLRNTPSCSSPASASIGTSALVLNQTSIPLPSVDLRRLSVPNYPTWQRSPQPRITRAAYSSGGLPENAFPMGQTSSPYDHMEGAALAPTTVTSTYERRDHILQVGECNAHSADAYRNLTPNEISTVYNHDLSTSDAQSLSFDFTRPHTSSGITLTFEDSHSPQILPKVYGSPIIANSKELECFDESSGATSTSLPTCTDASMQVWSEPPASSASIATFRRLSLALKNHHIDPTQASLFSAHSQVNEHLKCQSSESFRTTGASEIPLFPSICDIPYDVHLSQHPATCSAIRQTDNVLSVERCSDEVNQASEPLHLFQMDPGCHNTFAEMASHIPHENLRLSSCSYIRSCALTEGEGQKDQSPNRKESSSSLSSSNSTQELNLSPARITTQHPSVKNPCCTPCSMTSPHPENHFYRSCFLPQRLSSGNPSLTTIDLCSQPGHPERWAPQGLIPSLESPPYDFKAILEQKGTGFHSIDAHEDDSPTSTAPSNTSGAQGAT